MGILKVDKHRYSFELTLFVTIQVEAFYFLLNKMYRCTAKQWSSCCTFLFNIQKYMLKWRFLRESGKEYEGGCFEAMWEQQRTQ